MKSLKEDLTVVFIRNKHSNNDKAVFTIDHDRVGKLIIDFEDKV